MGDAGTSMFYVFAIFIAAYFIGMGIYLMVQRIRKMNERKRDSRFREN